MPNTPDTPNTPQIPTQPSLPAQPEAQPETKQQQIPVQPVAPAQPEQAPQPPQPQYPYAQPQQVPTQPFYYQAPPQPNQYYMPPQNQQGTNAYYGQPPQGPYQAPVPPQKPEKKRKRADTVVIIIIIITAILLGFGIGFYAGYSARSYGPLTSYNKQSDNDDKDLNDLLDDMKNNSTNKQNSDSDDSEDALEQSYNTDYYKQTLTIENGLAEYLNCYDKSLADEIDAIDYSGAGSEITNMVKSLVKIDDDTTDDVISKLRVASLSLDNKDSETAKENIQQAIATANEAVKSCESIKSTNHGNGSSRTDYREAISKVSNRWKVVSEQLTYLMSDNISSSTLAEFDKPLYKATSEVYDDAADELKDILESAANNR